MLDTLLYIGKKLREAKKLDHLEHIKRPPKSTNKMRVKYLRIPVRNGDFHFDDIDAANLSSLITKDEEKEQLFFLNFKTSGADSTKKYLFGDILYGQFKKSDGDLNYGSSNYRLGDENKLNEFRHGSFIRAEKYAKEFNSPIIKSFRAEFAKNLSRIEKLLLEEGNEQYVYLHFDFDGEHWYQNEAELREINDRMLGDVSELQNGHLALTKSFHKTLIGSDSHSPGFGKRNYYKNKVFKSHEEIEELMYALDLSKHAATTIGGDIKIVVLPRGEYLTADHIEDFFEGIELKNTSAKEADINKVNKPAQNEDAEDDFISDILGRADTSITQFDFIFSKQGSNTEIDMLELSGIDRSSLSDLADRIHTIRRHVDRERKYTCKQVPKDFKSLEISNAFARIFGDFPTARGLFSKGRKKTYQNHLLKVLPQIFCWNYYNDKILLPTFLETIEFETRNREAKEMPAFNLLKFDYEFLARLRNTKGENPVKEMKDRQNYKAGWLLGDMAKPLQKEMGSFERNTVGQLRRRIADPPSLLALSNTIREKLALHGFYEKHSYLEKLDTQFSKEFGEISETDYDRDEFAYGFLDGYFTYSKSKEPKAGGQTTSATNQPTDETNVQSEENEGHGNE